MLGRRLTLLTDTSLFHFLITRFVISRHYGHTGWCFVCKGETRSIVWLGKLFAELSTILRNQNIIISLDDETQYICQDEFNECFFASLPAHEARWIDGLTKWKLFVKFPFLFTSSLLRYCSLNHIKQPSLWMQRFLRRDNKERKPTTDFNLFMKVGFAHLFPLFIGVANDHAFTVEQMNHGFPSDDFLPTCA